MRTFVITGASDGIGLLTAKLLAQSAPAVQDQSQVRIIGVHGRSSQKIQQAIQTIQTKASAQKNNFKLVPFCYDLNDYNQNKAFVDDIKAKFQPNQLGNLDCLVLNAGICDSNGPGKSADNKFERTFMVNVFSPFYMTLKLLQGGVQPQRIVITSSGAHNKHTQKIDYNNLQFEKGGWQQWKAYCHSKMLVIMATRGFYLQGQLPAHTTLLNQCPNFINTKLTGNSSSGMPLDRA